MNWYYIDGPKRVGPFTETEWDALLRRGTILPETRVWNEDLSGWMPWSEVPKEPFPVYEALLGEDAGLPISASQKELLAKERGDDQEEDLFARHARRRLEAASQGQAGAADSEGSLDAPVSELDPATIQQLEHDALEPDYQVAFWPIFRSALQLVRGHLLQLGGGTLLIYGLIFFTSSIPVVSLVMSLALSGVLMGGLFSLYIKRWRGEPATTMEVFSGFEQGYFKNLALKTAVSNLIVMAFFVPGAIAAKIVGLDFTKFKSEADVVAAITALEPMALLMLLFLFGSGALVAVYFNICWLFSLPLIRDKGLPYRQAMRLSRLRVLQHPWRILWTLFLSSVAILIPCFFVMFMGILVSGGNEGSPLVSFLSFLLLLFCLPVMTAVIIGIYREAFGPLAIPRVGRKPGEGDVTREDEAEA